MEILTLQNPLKVENEVDVYEDDAVMLKRNPEIKAESYHMEFNEELLRDPSTSEYEVEQCEDTPSWTLCQQCFQLYPNDDCYEKHFENSTGCNVHKNSDAENDLLSPSNTLAHSSKNIGDFEADVTTTITDSEPQGEKEDSLDIPNVQGSNGESNESMADKLSNQTFKNFETSYKCKLCGISFSDASQLTANMLNHICYQQNSIVDNNSIKNKKSEVLQNHIIEEEYEDMEICEEYNCNDDLSNQFQCSYGFACNTQMTRSSKSIFSLSKSNISRGESHCCNYCNRLYIYQSSLEKHHDMHVGAQLNGISVRGYRNKNKKFHCTNCKRSFIKKNNLKKHLERHSLAKTKASGKKSPNVTNTSRYPATKSKYSCQHCDRSFTYKGNLQNHLTLHRNHVPSEEDSSEIPQFICTHCSKCFIYEENLLTHMSYHTDALMNSPVVIDDPIIEREELNNESDTDISFINYSCNFCKQSFTCQSSLLSHLELHKEQNLNIEPTSEFGSSNEIINPMDYDSVLQNFTCAYCSTSFPFKEDLMKHIQIHVAKRSDSNVVDNDAVIEVDDSIDDEAVDLSGPEVDASAQKFSCDNCKMSFAFMENLIEHNKIHAIIRSNYTVRSDDLSSKTNYINQYRKADMVISISYSCDYCKRFFSCRSDLEKHLNTENHYSLSSYNNILSTEKEFNRDNVVNLIAPNFCCPYCDRSFVSKEYLINHAKIHASANELDIVRRQTLLQIKDCCSYCKNSSKDVSNFNWFTCYINESCYICNKPFTCRMLLKKHESFHLKPYRCKYCDESFVYESNLMEHEQYHLGLKPYSCNNCGKSFSFSTNFYAHLKSRICL